eukprot:TRINITY_DN777845_c0_g1_i1.p1 TRINITY_DN777845_c0_g1~~TRINITY_DN777845_c0_g1_i1.p1  ORF type:complete len:276 (-),score=65.43 TRINITY_DN777845_c0_g1_i1:239-1021(-)
MSAPGEEFISKEDSSVVFKKLQEVSANRVCFDCSKKNPKWASSSLGVFLCLNCAGFHRSLGVYYTFVRSLTMDKWRATELKSMELGGNAELVKFFKRNGWTARKGTNLEEKYTSPISLRYKDQLARKVQQALKKEGSKVKKTETKDEDSETKEADFFEMAEKKLLAEQSSRESSPAPGGITVATKIVKTTPAKSKIFAKSAPTSANASASTSPANSTASSPRVTMTLNKPTTNSSTSSLLSSSRSRLAMRSRRTLGRRIG